MMTEDEAQSAFETMTEKQQQNVQDWHRKNPHLTFAQVVELYYVRPAPAANPDEAIGRDTLAGKLRDRNRGRR